MKPTDYREFQSLHAELRALKQRIDELAEDHARSTPENYERITHEHGVLAFKMASNLRRLSALLERVKDLKCEEEAAAYRCFLGDLQTAFHRARRQARRWRNA
ncbi:MAG: hypothetical protein ACYCSN_17525 [Acidobacteriaceae bacterium]